VVLTVLCGFVLLLRVCRLEGVCHFLLSIVVSNNQGFGANLPSFPVVV
jgi:hypothetical protein